MPTCEQLERQPLVGTGGYIDWSAVHGFVLDRAAVVLAGVGPGTPYHTRWPNRVDTQRYQRAFHASWIVSTLELMFGQNLGSLPEATIGLTAGQLRGLFTAVVSVQRSALTPEVQNYPGGSGIPSGPRGWWLPPVGASEIHHCAVGADFYMLLRRNPAALQDLYNASQLRPLGLEHKLLPRDEVWPFPTLGPTGVDGGGRTNLYAWLEEVTAALALQGICALPTPDRRADNFWGEMIGVVGLVNSMFDVFNAWVADFRVLPLTPSDCGMGQSITRLFQAWRSRPPPYGAGPNSFIGSITSSCACEWNGNKPSGSNSPNTYEFFDAAGQTLTGQAGLEVGQDWDCSLHQLARAVLMMHHLGYQFTAADRQLILQRLLDWEQQICELPDPACSTGATQGQLAQFVGPTERYADFFGPLQTGCIQGTGLPLGALAPSVDTILASVLAAKWSGVASLGAGGPLLQRMLNTLATLYRSALGPGGAGWTNWDDGAQDNGGFMTDMLSTYYAVATLMALDTPTTGFSGCSGAAASPLLNGFGVSPDLGLTQYGIFGPSLAGVQPPQWFQDYVAG